MDLYTACSSLVAWPDPVLQIGKGSGVWPLSGLSLKTCVEGLGTMLGFGHSSLDGKSWPLRSGNRAKFCARHQQIMR